MHTVPTTYSSDILRRRARNFAEVVYQRELGVPGHVAVGDFLDAFYAAGSGRRQVFLDTEPPVSGAMTQAEVATLAAIAEQLAGEYDLQVPEWTTLPRYFLSDNQAVCGPISCQCLSPSSVETLRRESPSAFARRNLLVSANALTRV
ncbi:MAG: hypothetical protein LBJ07_01970 [Actinomycetes bacterium]|jgi:hypothetical protein|nr:hypothetical protein [Actinomycetes bacterium]